MTAGLGFSRLGKRRKQRENKKASEEQNLGDSRSVNPRIRLERSFRSQNPAIPDPGRIFLRRHLPGKTSIPTFSLLPSSAGVRSHFSSSFGPQIPPKAILAELPPLGQPEFLNPGTKEQNHPQFPPSPCRIPGAESTEIPPVAQAGVAGLFQGISIPGKGREGFSGLPGEPEQSRAFPPPQMSRKAQDWEADPAWI